MKRLSTLDVVVRRSSVGVCFLCLVSLSVPGGVEAQVRSMQFQPGGSIQVQGLNAAQAAAAKQAADAAKAAQKAAAAKGAKPPTKPGAKPGAKPATAAKGKGKTEAKIIKRGDIKIDPGDPKELEVKPIDGMIKLSFRGQKWPALLDWYSRATGTNIDWQELPNDQINLSTQREVTMEEVRDLLNIHLLDRGYTMIKHGDLLRVVATKSINISKVPLVRVSDLETLMPHDFVRVMIPLSLMQANQAATSLKELLSPNGKMIPLPGSNRIVAMDAVEHLQELHQVLQEEQVDSAKNSMREFSLRFTRAEEIKEKVMELMGGSTSSSTSRSSRSMSSSSARQMQMMMQQQQQLMQQLARARGGSKAPAAAASSAPSVPLKIVANPRRNSLLVQAPPQKMLMIQRAIEILDVPNVRANSLQGYLERVQVYRLATLDPEKLATALREMGTLDPSAKIQVDEAGRALIVDAPMVDHMSVRAIIQKLDGSARKFEVIAFTRLDALEVAGSIDLMIGNANKAKKRRSYDYWDPWDWRRNNNKSDDEDRFRVEADVANKRILLWANEQELASVKTLLTKLGEDPEGRRSNRMVRTLEIMGDESTDEFLKRIKKQWESMSPNSVVLPDPLPKKAKADAAAKPATKKKDESEKASKDAKDVKQPPKKAVEKTTTAANTSSLADSELTSAKTEDEVSQTKGEEQPAKSPPPIRITRGPDGRLVISSPDTKALDAFEQLMMQTAPRQPKYKIFKLKEAPAFWIKIRIEDYFEDEEEEDDRPWWAWDMPREEKDDTARLSKKKPIKIISDFDTNTILVQGASPKQFATIQELIDLYDVPERISAPTARSVQLFPIKHSKAEIVANVIKDAFRDLLSSNDKALSSNSQRKQGGQNGGGGGGGGGSADQPRSSFALTTSSYLAGFGINENPKEIDPKKPPTEVDFKGQLSIGIDSTTNTLLVSTEGPELMEIIEKMIEALDQSARPLDNMRVVRVSGSANPAAVHKALMGILNQQQGKQNPNQQKQPNQPQPNNQPNNAKNPNNNRAFSPGNNIQTFESNGMRIDTVVDPG